MPVHRTVAFTEVHKAHSLEYADTAARMGAIGLLPADIGRIAHQLDDGSFWILADDSPLTWKAMSLELTTTPPLDLGPVALAGTSAFASREDHVHRHGVVAGGATHALAVAGSPGTAGYISGANQLRLDNLLEVLDEGSTLGTGKTKVNFQGAGVLAVVDGGDPNQINVTVPGSGTATFTVKEEGVDLTPDKNKLNFIGPGLTATTDGGDPFQANITVAVAAPVSVADANAAGAADALSRADHAHRATFPAHLLGASSIAATTTTRYLTPGSNAVAPTAAVPYRLPSSGTLRRLRVRVNSPAGNGNAVVYTVRINGVPTALTCSVASTANDGSDLVNTVAVAAGDLIDIEVTKAVAIGAAISDVVASLEVFV